MPRPGSNRVLEARVVSSAEEMQQVVAIRSAVYIGEQNCPYEEEFDGNDFAATHILGLVDARPVATLRIRWFADFAKPERLAVLRDYRGSGISTKVIDTGFEICRRKGYRKIYGHAQRRLLKFWADHGMTAMDGRVFNFSDHEYVEIAGDFERKADAITLDAGPMVILRPEGRWDEPGVLELSQSRPATNPGAHP